jgi:hypothetical protein
MSKRKGSAAKQEQEQVEVRESLSAVAEPETSETLESSSSAAPESPAADAEVAAEPASAGFDATAYASIPGVEDGETFIHEPEVVAAVGVDVARRDTEAKRSGTKRDEVLTLPERQSIKQAKRKLTLARAKSAEVAVS